MNGEITFSIGYDYLGADSSTPESGGIAGEQQALKDVSRLLGVRVNTDGHDPNDDSLWCMINVYSWAEAKKLLTKITTLTASDGVIETSVPFFNAAGFKFYPVAGRDEYYTEDGQHPADGEWVGWLEAHEFDE